MSPHPFISAFVSALLVPFALQGQIVAKTVWTIEDCVTIACNGNHAVKRQILAKQSSRNNLLKAKAAILPTLNAGMEYTLNWGRSVDMQELVIVKNKLNQAGSFSVSSTFPLFEGLSNWYRIKQMEAELNMAEEQVEITKDEIAVETIKAFTEILLCENIYKEAETGLESICRDADRTSALVTSGKQPYSSHLEMESQKASERVKKVEASGRLKLAKAALLKLLGIDIGTEFELITPTLADDGKEYSRYTLDDIRDAALNISIVKRQENEISSLKHKLSSIKGEILPHLRISAGYGTYISDASQMKASEQLSNNRNPSIGLSLSIPIFNGMETATKISNAEIELKSSLLSSEETIFKVTSELRTLIVECDNYREKMIAATSNCRAMEELMRSNQVKFENGRITGTEYLIARNNYLEAESELLRSKYQYLCQQMIVKYYFCKRPR